MPSLYDCGAAGTYFDAALFRKRKVNTQETLPNIASGHEKDTKRPKKIKYHSNITRNLDKGQEQFERASLAQVPWKSVKDSPALDARADDTPDSEGSYDDNNQDVASLDTSITEDTTLSLGSGEDAGDTHRLGVQANKSKCSTEVPTNLPVAAFNISHIPPKEAQWDQEWPAPTCTFPDVVDCPINWSYICECVPGLTDHHIRAYELRAPWNPPGHQMAFRQVLAQIRAEGNTQVDCEEAVRKRFVGANWRVYQATGVYFENSATGLKEFGILTRRQLGRAPSDNQSSQNRLEICSEDTIYFILKPPAGPEDRCQGCCDEGFCYDQGCQEDDCCRICCEEVLQCWSCRMEPLDPDPECQNCGSELQCCVPCEHRKNGPTPNHSTEQWRAHLESTKVPFGCPKHQPIIVRQVDWTKLNAISMDFQSVNILNVEQTPFDIFTSLIAPTICHEVPDSFHILKEHIMPDDSEGLVYVESAANHKLSDILKAYCCSQALQCPSVSNVILRHFVKIIKDEENLLAKYRSGLLNMHDREDVRYRVLDFEPEDINYVFNNTDLGDPIRLLLLDVIEYKSAAGRSKIEAAEDEYHPEFVRLWTIRELNRELQETSHQFRNVFQKMQELAIEFHGAMSDGAHQSKLNDLFDEIQTLNDNAKNLLERIRILPGQIKDITSQGVVLDPSGDSLVGVLVPPKHRVNEDLDDGDNIPQRLWGGFEFRCWKKRIPGGYRLDKWLRELDTVECLRRTVKGGDEWQFQRQYFN